MTRVLRLRDGYPSHMGDRSDRRVVVITGATSGVGRATARAFAREGASIGLLARGPVGLDGTRDELTGMGVKAESVQTDVSDPDQVRRAADRIEEALGPIDVWVNDAMVTVFGPVSAITPEEFERVTAVTYLGTVYGTMTALERMRARDRGVIVQVGSALAERSIPLQAAYCGAKHAVKGFTEALRCELLHERSGVRVTMVQLPATNTPQFRWSHNHMRRRPQPVPPIYQPEIAADAIVWASRHPRREVKVGAPTAATMLTEKWAAGLLDRYLAWRGYDAQQTDMADDPNRPDTLFSSVPFDLGAHGAFDDRSHAHSAQWWATKHRGALLTAGAAGLAAAAARKLR
jgi:NAD(P)-dependent dehydrogenase (short-subunit alcohol dehydrogenase family)